MVKSLYKGSWTLVYLREQGAEKSLDLKEKSKNKSFRTISSR